MKTITKIKTSSEDQQEFYYVKIITSPKYWYQGETYLNQVFKIENKLHNYYGGPGYKIVLPRECRGNGLDPHDVEFVHESMLKEQSEMKTKIEKTEALIAKMKELWN